MKHSIKTQVTLVFGGVMAGMLVLFWVVNILFLEKFYTERKENIIESAYRQIDEKVSSGDLTSEDFEAEFRSLAGTYNLEMIILDTDTETVLTTTRDSILARRLIEYVIYGDSTSKVVVSTDTYRVQLSDDRATRLEYIELWGFLSDGRMILIRTPIEGIRDSAAVSNTLLTYVGIFVIAIGMFIVRAAAKKVTKPILELADISEKMASLDFDVKYQSGGENEIALLGQNINDLSKKLEVTISELKTANNELKRDLEKKEEIDEQRKEFLSNVSHELKTPIALIQGYAEGLKENVNSDEESRDFYCDVIIDEASKMNRLVMNLLELSHLENGRMDLTMERFDIVLLIKNCVNSVGILLEQNGIRLRFEQEKPIYVWADEFKTEEIINNYLSNAIHYAKGEKLIEIRIEEKENIARIKVFNTGDPVPEESLERIWTKFYKVDKARTREYGGSGIGLSIVKAIMDSFNQDCGVKNYENGVEFWFELDTKS